MARPWTGLEALGARRPVRRSPTGRGPGIRFDWRPALAEPRREKRPRCRAEAGEVSRLSRQAERGALSVADHASRTGSGAELRHSSPVWPGFAPRDHTLVPWRAVRPGSRARARRPIEGLGISGPRTGGFPVSRSLRVPISGPRSPFDRSPGSRSPVRSVRPESEVPISGSRSPSTGVPGFRIPVFPARTARGRRALVSGPRRLRRPGHLRRNGPPIRWTNERTPARVLSMNGFFAHAMACCCCCSNACCGVVR